MQSDFYTTFGLLQSNMAVPEVMGEHLTHCYLVVLLNKVIKVHEENTVISVFFASNSNHFRVPLGVIVTPTSSPLPFTPGVTQFDQFNS